MGEQGGDSEGQNRSVSTNYVNSKIVTTTIVVVILGISFVAALVYFGIQASKQREPEVATNNQPTTVDDPVLETIKVDYEETQTAYTPAQTSSKKTINSLMAKYGVDDAEYAIIRTASDLEDFVATINAMNSDKNATPFVYELNSDFFKTGSVIVVAKEDEGLESMCIDDVYRDENYNIHIGGSYASPSDTTTPYGKVSFLQIQNIQPKTVEVKWNEDVDDPVYNPGDVTVKKPIIYLYPDQTTNVSVRLSNPERITTDYPNYNQGWDVVAHPDGTLATKNGKKLYALYYESLNIKHYTDASLKEGFVVTKDDVEDFLDAKLTTLGLNYKEREEFITYWANILESKPYAFIRFQTADEVERNMGLSVSPKPDTTIRIMMEYKLLDQKIETKAQQLKSVERKGFTVVEWGGTEIKL